MSSEDTKHIRYDRLQVVCKKALEESQKVITDENLYSCFPSLASTDEGRRLIDVVKKQLIESWKTNTEKEFDAIFKERHIETKLNELDELISDAQMRQKQTEQVSKLHIDQLTPSNIVASHLLPLKEQNIKSLQSQLRELHEGNLQLFNELNDLVKQSKDLKSEVSSSLKSVSSLNDMMKESKLEQNLKTLIQITSSEEQNV